MPPRSSHQAVSKSLVLRMMSSLRSVFTAMVCGDYLWCSFAGWGLEWFRFTVRFLGVTSLEDVPQLPGKGLGTASWHNFTHETQLEGPPDVKRCPDFLANTRKTLAYSGFGGRGGGVDAGVC